MATGMMTRTDAGVTVTYGSVMPGVSGVMVDGNSCESKDGNGVF